MTSSGQILRISVSSDKGTKKQNVERACLVDDFGLEGDAHAGSDRQVSLLPYESFARVQNDLIDIKPGDFAENITTVGLDYSQVRIGKSLRIGDSIRLIITQIGKECHRGCYIREIVGDCIMPREGVFARVGQGGTVGIGDSIRWE